MTWEEKVVEFLEESVELEGEAWGHKLADELAPKVIVRKVAPLLAAVSGSNTAHLNLLLDLVRTQAGESEYSRAIGIASKRNLIAILKMMEDCCAAEDLRKVPVRLLGLVKDAKAAACAEAAKAGLLRAYGEICRKADPVFMYTIIEKQILPWILRQLNECKEISTKEAGLVALEQVISLFQSC